MITKMNIMFIDIMTIDLMIIKIINSRGRVMMGMRGMSRGPGRPPLSNMGAMPRWVLMMIKNDNDDDHDDDDDDGHDSNDDGE